MLARRLHHGRGPSGPDGRAADGDRRRRRPGARLPGPDDEHEESPRSRQRPTWAPDKELPTQPRVSGCRSLRHDAASATCSRRDSSSRSPRSATSSARPRARPRATPSPPASQTTPRRLDDGGTGAHAYADAVATYLAFAVDKLPDYGLARCALVAWPRLEPRSTFARQALPMVWDFAEANPLQSSTGSVSTCGIGCGRAIGRLGRRPVPAVVEPGGCRTASIVGHGGRRIDRPAVLRQHRLRGPLGLLLRLAPALAR